MRKRKNVVDYIEIIVGAVAAVLAAVGGYKIAMSNARKYYAEAVRTLAEARAIQSKTENDADEFSINTLKEVISQLRLERAQDREERKNDRANIEKARREIESLKGKVETLENQRTTQEQEIKNLKDRVAELESSNMRKDAEIERLMNENARLKGGL